MSDSGDSTPTRTSPYLLEPVVCLSFRLIFPLVILWSWCFYSTLEVVRYPRWQSKLRSWLGVIFDRGNWYLDEHTVRILKLLETLFWVVLSFLDVRRPNGYGCSIRLWRCHDLWEVIGSFLFYDNSEKVKKDGSVYVYVERR